jgi:hypothetical protein
MSFAFPIRSAYSNILVQDEANLRRLAMLSQGLYDDYGLEGRNGS